MALRLECLKPYDGSDRPLRPRGGVAPGTWVILTQTLVRVLCGYPSRTRGWANSWYLSWYLRSDPLVISPLGGVFPVVLVVTSMGFTIFYIIAAIAPASAKLQPRAVRHGFLNVRSDYPTGVATHTLAVASTGPTHKEEYLLEKAMHTPPQTTNIYCNASSTQYDSISCSSNRFFVGGGGAVTYRVLN